MVSFVVRRTAFGYRLLAIGGNRRASVLAGLPVQRTIIAVYAISGTLAAIAGVIATARLRAADPSYIGLLIELSAITAVVVGGNALNGGQVRILGTVAGAVLIQLLETTLVSHNVPDSVARIVEALIIIAAVYIQRLEEERMTVDRHESCARPDVPRVVAVAADRGGRAPAAPGSQPDLAALAQRGGRRRWWS